MPAIAVFPYASLPDGLLKPDFAKSVTLRVTETLKRVDALHVTSASSALNLVGNLSIPEVGRLLNVDYLLKGQILRAGSTLFFNQRLYEAPSGQLILEAEIECGLGELAGFERDILARVIADVRLPLQEAEIDRIMARGTRSASAYELVIRAQLEMQSLNRRSLATAGRLLVRAQTIDPGYASAYAWMARHHSIRIGQGWSEDRTADSRAARQLAERALELDPANAIALATAGHLRSYLDKDYVAGEALLRRAIEACPNEPLGWLLLSATLAYTGRASEGRENVEYALTLSPLDAYLYAFYNFAAVCCYAQGDFEQAVEYARQCHELNPRYSTNYKVLAISLVGLGAVAEARATAAELRRLEPGYTADVAAGTVPFEDPIARRLFVRRLKTAGAFDVNPSRSRKRKT